MNFKFDGFIRLHAPYRYWGHHCAHHDFVDYHAFGLWVLAFGWHFRP